MRINFLVADEIRQEAGGKQAVLGLFADSVVVLESPPNLDTSASELPAGIERLAFLINISDLPEGKHSYRGQIIDPSGNPHGSEIPLGNETSIKGRSRTLVVEAKPFLVKGKGEYRFDLYVDDELHSLPFWLIEKGKE